MKPMTSLTQSQQSYSQPTPSHTSLEPQTPSAKVERVKRPVISSAGTSEDWNYFLSRWNDYVEATKVTGKDEVLQLLECCDEELRRDVTRMAGGSLTNKTAEEALAAIRTLAVREESPMVARAALYAMHQDRDEPVRTFAVRSADVRRRIDISACLLRHSSDSEVVGVAGDVLGWAQWTVPATHVCPVRRAEEYLTREGARSSNRCDAKVEVEFVRSDEHPHHVGCL